VALVATGLAFAGGTAYVSLMHVSSHAPGEARVLERPSTSSAPSIRQLPAYLDAAFANLRPVMRPAPMMTASLGPQPTFAARFAGVVTDVYATSSSTQLAAAPPPTRSLARPQTRVAKVTAAPVPMPRIRAAALRMDERAPAIQPRSYQVASYAPTRDDRVDAPPFTLRSDIHVPPLEKAETTLEPFENAPFPVRTASTTGSESVRIHFRSKVTWEKGAFSDPRVLLHIPKGFDPNKPAVMVVFFHGHGATLTRDVLNRQEVPLQISESHANAVLVAPQLAYDARSSNPGNLWEPGAFARMVREAGERLTRLYGDPRVGRTFANMPIIIVAYSGGYLSAATSIERGGLKNRIQGVVLLDALYGELDGFSSWIRNNRSGFFVSSWTHSTQRRNAQLEEMLASHDVSYGHALAMNRLDGKVVFVPGEDGIRHRDFVNHAWADKPIKDILDRLPEYRL
jgi:hypothetical protein